MQSSGDKGTFFGSKTSLLALLGERAANQPESVAHRFKKRGLWHSVTWRALDSRVADLAAGMRSFQVKPDTTVAVAAQASDDWLASILALHAVGARPICLYQNLGVEQLTQLMHDLPLAGLIVDGLDWPILLAGRGLRLPQAVFLLGDEPSSGKTPFKVTRLVDIESAGRAFRQSVPFGQAERRESDPPLLFSTAATCGEPKVVAHSSQSLIAMGRALAGMSTSKLGAKDTAVLELPAGHIGAFVVAVILPLLTGVVTHLPEEIVAESIVDVRPTFSFSLGRPWEVRRSRVRLAADQATGVRGRIFRSAERAREYVGAVTAVGRAPSLRARASSTLSFVAVFLSLLQKLGLNALREALVIGPVAPELTNTWSSWGVSLRQVYFLVETGLLAEVDATGSLRPAPGVELRIDERGILLVRTPALCAGYWRGNRIERANDDSGWFRTDDIAIARYGKFALVGRRADGAQPGATPQPLARIDAALRTSPYLRSAATLAGPGGELSAVLDLDFESLATWAATNHIAFRTPSALRESDEVKRLVAGVFAEVNSRCRSQGLPSITSFRLSARPFAIGRELSPTWAVRRMTFGPSVAAAADRTS